MTTPSQPQPTDTRAAQPFSLLHAVVIMTAVVAGVTALLVFALEQLGATAQKPYAIYAGLICGGAAIVALLPVWWLSRRSLHGAAMGFMAGIVVRMALCGMAAIFGARMAGVERMPWSMWIAGWYMLVLMVEVALVGRYVARAKGPVIEPGVGKPTQDANVEYRATQ